MRREVALTDRIDQQAQDHLLRHYRRGQRQEDLCLGLWYSSRGSTRLTALLFQLILPEDGEVHLHGNASFEGRYITRGIREAKKRNAGLALLHSHPFPGWQDLSQTDIVAERDEVAYPAQATGKPLLGMTIGKDGYWSARFWDKKDNQMVGTWCQKVRVPALNRYRLYWKPTALKRLQNSRLKRRTIDTWGIGTQRNIESLRIGIVGVGSVGAVIAETLARMGLTEITLIDPDIIEPHNLDRLLYGTRSSIGEFKVARAETELRRHTTASDLQVRTIPCGIEYENAYREALDCDLIVSCVDRPVARDVLNHAAIAHLIPVIEGGIAVETHLDSRDFVSARWRSHLVVPGRACIRCTGQYKSSDVIQELDGSLDDPSYIAGLPPELRPRNQNVFPFSLGSASLQANLMIRYLIGQDWWPTFGRQEYRYITGRTYTSSSDCNPYCTFRERISLGDNSSPSYLRPPRSGPPSLLLRERLLAAVKQCLTVLPWARKTSTSDAISAR